MGAEGLRPFLIVHAVSTNRGGEPGRLLTLPLLVFAPIQEPNCACLMLWDASSSGYDLRANAVAQRDEDEARASQVAEFPAGS
jgi:hypothetical protein